MHTKEGEFVKVEERAKAIKIANDFVANEKFHKINGNNPSLGIDLSSLLLRMVTKSETISNTMEIMMNPKPITLRKVDDEETADLMTRMSSSQAAIIPVLPTILFSLPLCVPYFLALRLAASRTLSPPICTKISYLFGSALLAVPAMYLFTSDTAPNTFRKRHMLLWPWEDQKLIHKANQCVENVLTSEEIISENDVRHKLIEHIMNRLWENNKNLVQNDDIKKPTVYLIKNDDLLDGVSYPCSTITLTTCWLRLVDYDEDLLAVVLSHEIAHILQNHASEFYGLSFTLKALTQLREFFYTIKSIIPGMNRESNLSRPSVYLQKHSQLLEQEADLLGQEIMANAGYDPAKAIELWELMCNISSPKVPDDSHDDDGHGVRHSSENCEENPSFKYHPSREQRVKYLTENLINVQKIYSEKTKIITSNNNEEFERDLGLRRLELTVCAIFGER
ncbi:20248_t:CDS:2 [Funneliformis geosporum]|uniref:1204_t:CDS:1 n=1 Tax=Funneliformis geosporum TaxID=1117311 RepID=A0A9W4SJ20_9GLOM|nr:1204_t:CDS:2 [Funneliformis geosporum]CAI2183486.1 20248_t:CDS:2 [Funneliformis geosporum]